MFAQVVQISRLFNESGTRALKITTTKNRHVKKLL